MKNVVLWLSEMYPSNVFVNENLISLLKMALQFVKICLINNALPSFMIEERNLFADRVRREEKLAVCLKIDELQIEGPDIILRCKRVAGGMNKINTCPDDFYRYSSKRHMLEISHLEGIVYDIEAEKNHQQYAIRPESVLRLLKLTDNNPMAFFSILS
jgi:hypothetical protein